jgi:hypothetical protein
MAVPSANPTNNPGTVSQLGIRRLRKSIHPAAQANTTAHPTTTRGEIIVTPTAHQRAADTRIFTRPRPEVNETIDSKDSVQPAEK